jgi:hypothetical protein
VVPVARLKRSYVRRFRCRADTFRCPPAALHRTRSSARSRTAGPCSGSFGAITRSPNASSGGPSSFLRWDRGRMRASFDTRGRSVALSTKIAGSFRLSIWTMRRTASPIGSACPFAAPPRSLATRPPRPPVRGRVRSGRVDERSSYARARKLPTRHRRLSPGRYGDLVFESGTLCRSRRGQRSIDHRSSRPSRLLSAQEKQAPPWRVTVVDRGGRCPETKIASARWR